MIACIMTTLIMVDRLRSERGRSVLLLRRTIEEYGDFEISEKSLLIFSNTSTSLEHFRNHSDWEKTLKTKKYFPRADLFRVVALKCF
ncbi:Zinc finger protein [Dirofilaria immitis]